jgi:hypothetical protein
MSKESGVTARTTSSARIPGTAAMASRKTASAPCGTATSFGRSVEPEV